MIIPIHSLEDIKEQTCLIYKHSSTCPVSAAAKNIVESFSKDHPEIPIYMMVVQEDPELKIQIQDKFSIKLETPQIIVPKEG